MSFSILKAGELRKMSHEEVSHHQINQFGDSDLPVYRDSIFYFCPVGNTEYHIARIIKKDVELVVDKPTLLSGLQVGALLIDDKGDSHKSDLSGYKFTCKYLKADSFEVTKQVKSV